VEGGFEARVIRRIAPARDRVLGVFRRDSQGGRIMPIDKGTATQWVVVPGGDNGARDGELVEGEAAGPKGRLGLPKARITARLGDPGGPRAVSLIAIHQHDIPDVFSDAAHRRGETAQPASLEGREDLTGLPLVTIDPADARDRDDAVLAIPEEDGGFTLWVAIADVAHYVRAGTALDREARERGNSTYFPDRVVPMLPRAPVGRPVLAPRGRGPRRAGRAHAIDGEGAKLGHAFVRGVMRSRASLEYGQAQAAIDGRPDDRRRAPPRRGLRPLFGAYAALRAAREARQPLDLDLPERRIELSPEGKVLSVAFKDRLDAHRLIEEFMVLANVAAAEELTARRVPLLFRVHEAPEPLKMDALREVAEASGLTSPRGQVLRTSHLNRLLARRRHGRGRGHQHGDAALAPPGLLRAREPPPLRPRAPRLRPLHLAHPPLRRPRRPPRPHRAHGWGPDGLTDDEAARLPDTGEHISATERRSMQAERDTSDRYLAAFLSERVGSEIEGRISGVARFGLFVKLDGRARTGSCPCGTSGPSSSASTATRAR
jgi:ribonuclease R